MGSATRALMGNSCVQERYSSTQDAFLAEVISTGQSDREMLCSQEGSKQCSEDRRVLPRLAVNGSPCVVKASAYDASSCLLTTQSRPLNELANLFSSPVTPVASPRSSGIDQD